MTARTLEWIGGIDGFLELIDQRLLPVTFEKLNCRNTEQLYDAIKTLAVRGAPAIGVAAGYGLVLAMQQLNDNNDMQKIKAAIEEQSQYLASSRPTAINLSWALNRIKEETFTFIESEKNVNVASVKIFVLERAGAICAEDIDMCKCIGENGQEFVKAGSGILTHCNAGALATAGQGTALSVIFEAHKRERKFKVYAGETRPLLQGARLTAWELRQAGIDVTLICDNMAGQLMKAGQIDAVIVGADRIAANGDTANKIGTYSLSILAKQHCIPFYVAAPSSTFDLSIANGSGIPIEQRDADEVTSFGKLQIAPDNIKVYNPAFDVTEAVNITAIITEKGIIEKPNTEKILNLLKS